MNKPSKRMKMIIFIVVQMVIHVILNIQDQKGFEDVSCPGGIYKYVYK